MHLTRTVKSFDLCIKKGLDTVQCTVTVMYGYIRQDKDYS